MKYLGGDDKPAITIGMPVYNGANVIKSTLDSLLNQTFKTFELIISDNASTDETEEICKAFAAKDDRIKYIRQSKNIGPVANFKYVLMAARGEYFMWAACDDIRSSDYLEVNYEALSKNSAYVASGSPNGFENWGSDRKLVNFSLEEDGTFERYQKFFQNCFQSHGLFYCLMRTQIVRNAEFLDQVFPEYDWLGYDWATILYLASKGKVNRALRGHIILGVRGISSNANIFNFFNSSKIEKFLPFYVLSKFVINLTKKLSSWQRVRILIALLKLNIFAKIQPILYRLYSRFLKPLVKLF